MIFLLMMLFLGDHNIFPLLYSFSASWNWRWRGKNGQGGGMRIAVIRVGKEIRRYYYEKKKGKRNKKESLPTLNLRIKKIYIYI